MQLREIRELPWKLCWSLIPESYYMRKHGVDPKAVQAIRKKYNCSEFRQKGLKYLRFNVRFRGRLRYALNLGLDKMTPINILDIGTGVGYFPYICKQFGHTASAMDLGDFPVFNDLIDMLDVDRTEYCVKAFEHLPPVDERFDLITAFLICFNNHNQENLWGIDEWDFFLKDLAANQLKRKGKVFLHFNFEQKTGKPFSQELAGYFVNHGAMIQNNEVSFSVMDSFFE